MGPRKTAAVVWASMNGAFMLMGDGNFFRDVTGLNPEHFVDEALESHLAASQLTAARRVGRGRISGRAQKSALYKDPHLHPLPNRERGREARGGYAKVSLQGEG
ncbi:MAG: hypothetical protein ACREQH_01140 [Candidatus Binatus sp.]